MLLKLLRKLFFTLLGLYTYPNSKARRGRILREAERDFQRKREDAQRWYQEELMDIHEEYMTRVGKVK